MIKIGDIVKLKNPKKKGEAKRRWRFITWHGKPAGTVISNLKLRRLDTIKRDIEVHPENLFVPISFWERIWKRLK